MENKIVELQEPIIELSKVIEIHHNNTYRKINEELIMMYLEIGKYLSKKISFEKWGTKMMDTLSIELRKRYPNMKGFEKRNLYRMIQFYETYRHNIIVSPLVTQISWTNNVIIFSHESSMEEKEFYIRLCIKNNYSKRELLRQISSNYYQRYIASNKQLMPKSDVSSISDPKNKILDTYFFEFVDLPDGYSEKDLRRALVSNLKKFILEIGNDFTFISEEYRIEVGGKDFYIDLLFFNRTYSCLVAFELKIGEFQPEYISKMNFYLEALDRQIKLTNENPSVGIILCTSKNDTIVEYALARSMSQTIVSEYKTKLIDKEALCKRVNKIAKLLKK